MKLKCQIIIKKQKIIKNDLTHQSCKSKKLENQWPTIRQILPAHVTLLLLHNTRAPNVQNSKGHAHQVSSADHHTHILTFVFDIFSPYLIHDDPSIHTLY